MKGEEKEKDGPDMHIWREERKEIAFVQILPWARHYPTDELTVFIPVHKMCVLAFLCNREVKQIAQVTQLTNAGAGV